MNKQILILFLLVLSSAPASAWDPIRDITKSVRRLDSNLVREINRKVVEAGYQLEEAVGANKVKKIAIQKVELASLKERAAELERQTQIKIEERALVELEKQLSGHRSIEYEINEATLTRIMDSLYAHEFEPEPRPFQNLVFIHTEPRTIGKLANYSEVIFRLVIYWRRIGERIDFRYSVLEKRLRSPEVRETVDPLAIQMTDVLINKLVAEMEKRPE